MDRRSFIKLTAVSGTSAALASCGNPENQFIRFLPDEDIVPGVAVWKPSVCPLCEAGCGLTVRVMEADAEVTVDGQTGIKRIAAAKKLEGAPEHPVNRGGLCARGQAAIQITYHPDRITQPLKRSGDRGTGQYAAISWEDAIAEVVGRLNGLDAANPRAFVFLTRRAGGHRFALTEQFAGHFGATPITFDLFGDDIVRRANAISFGRDQLPTFDLANARFILGFGADFMGSWNSPVAHSAAFGQMRRGRPGIRGRFAQIESRMSQTGASADDWVPARPGTEGVVALGIAHLIMAGNLIPNANAGAAGNAVAGWGGGLTDYTPQRVEELTGVPPARLEALAQQFAQMRPAVAIVGGPALAHTNSLFTATAVNALNALAGTLDQPGGITFTPQFNAGSALKLTALTQPATPLQMLASEALAGTAPQVLFVDGVNPVFTAPSTWRVREALERVPYIVSFGSFVDETTSLADIILPDHSFLESWVEAVPESGSTAAVASVAPPVMRPLYQTRSTPDVLLEIGRGLERPLGATWQTFDEMLAASFATLPSMTPDVDAWSDAQTKGVWSGTLPGGLTRETAAMSAAQAAAFEAPRFDGDPQQFPFHFLPYPTTQFGEGETAHLPWLQEMPDPLTSAMWSSWVEINPATAAKMGIAHGDVVEVASAHGSVRSGAVLTPGIAPDLIAMPMGQGHTMYTRYATGRGANPASILAPLTDAATGALAWAATRVRVTRVGPPDGSLILFAGGMREHPEEHR